MPDPSTLGHQRVECHWAREVRTRLRRSLSPTREAEIVDELSQHLDDRCRELIAGGASPDEATRLALAEFRERRRSGAAHGAAAAGARARRQSHRERRLDTCSAISGRTCATPRASFWKQPGFRRRPS